ncbi:endopeptidase La [Taibaiella koreensis]|uniref:endopeptidase La n=1 Tax=Taibaiella koreensis TaxID=1268548 RepID=UPI000E599FF0|nr:endopeptidase La [Taibaiella koreensis]
MNFREIVFNNMNENDMEFMPIVPLGEVEMEEQEKSELPADIPVIALRNTVLFPNVVLPITVSRDKSVKAIAEGSKNGGMIGVLAQKDQGNEDPETQDIHRVGTIAKIVKQIKMPDGNTTIFIMGRMRFEIEEYTQEAPFLRAKVNYLDDKFPKDDKEFDAMISSVKDMAERIIALSPNIPVETGMMLRNIENYSFLVHFIASNLETKLIEKQALLEQNDIKARTHRLIELLQADLQMAELKNEITTKTRGEIDKQQREYFLQQQLKSINEELGGEGNEREIKDLQKRAESKKWNEAAKETFKKGLGKLERMHPNSPDYSVVYNHLDLMLDLPWGEYTEDKYDLKKALKVLDADHYSMEKIKDRILEYLAVLKLKGDMKSPILCFVGPPGIGKTSLGQSIANAVNRKYVRLSLGGLHDESELRGHRKTYIGAMPGRIIQSLRKVKTSNPVFILDEIDKIGKDFRGDPSSALLEILDPEQNHTFYDNYLEMEYDLSKVLFIATANSLNDIQPALRDRLEIIQLSGYSVEEKVEIAKRHLLPKQKKAHGLDQINVKYTPTIIQQVIKNYSRESGVRELDRQLAAIMRSIARQVAMEDRKAVNIDAALIEKALGKPKYSNELYQKANPPGVAVGLAWTYVGGEILFIEVSLSKGKGGLTLTGNLGNVMKESASTALSYLKAHAEPLKIDMARFDETNIHIHVPEGAVPKDGPSAGVTMLSALTSAFTGRKVKPFLAMTGEITLRGQVLPVGGIKEKVLAAKRAGLKEILMCEQNRRDVEEINPEFIKGMKFAYVSEMGEVLEKALLKR